MEPTTAPNPFPFTETFGTSTEVFEPGVVFIKNAFNKDQQKWLAKYALKTAGVMSDDGAINLDIETRFWTIEGGKRKFNSAMTRGRIYDALHRLPETETLQKVCKALMKQVKEKDPSMPECNPTHLLLLYYASARGMGYHADNGENDGDNDHPIISFSLGNSCEFGMKLTKGEKKITLASGDIIIWGGVQRMMRHSVLSVKTGSSPHYLNLGREVRLNFTFRDAPNILGREEDFAIFDSQANSRYANLNSWPKVKLKDTCCLMDHFILSFTLWKAKKGSTHKKLRTKVRRKTMGNRNSLPTDLGLRNSGRGGDKLGGSRKVSKSSKKPAMVDSPPPDPEPEDKVSSSEGPLDLLDDIPKPVWPEAPVFPESLTDLTLVKELDGSSKPQKTQDKDAILWVVKKCSNPGQLNVEFSVNNAYRACGVRIPHYKVIGTGEDSRLVGQWIHGPTLHRVWRRSSTDKRYKALYDSVIEKLRQAFVMDCLFGNWDVIGKYSDNIIIDCNGDPWRVDNGGSLSYRAMGSKKSADQWGPDVGKEFFHMRHTNPKMEAIFGGITDEQILQQIRDCLTDRDKIMNCLPEDEHEVLNQRFDWLKQYLEDAKK